MLDRPIGLGYKGITMTNAANTPNVFGALKYRNGNPQTNEGRYMYPKTLSDVYRTYVGPGPVDVDRILSVLEHEICTPSGKTRGLREELFTMYLAVRDHANQK